MKTNILMIAVLALGLNAFAGNEGPQAVPTLQPTVVAEYMMNGGFFVPPNAPMSYHYQILTNRKAVRITYFRNDSAPKAQVLKTLTDTEWVRLVTLVKQIKPGATFDPNPSRPGCQDAPSYSFVVNTAKGSIKIGETYACKTMSRKNAGPADTEIMQILKNLETLTRN